VGGPPAVFRSLRSFCSLLELKKLEFEGDVSSPPLRSGPTVEGGPPYSLYCCLLSDLALLTLSSIALG